MIDPRFELKNSEHINDKIILEFVKKLDGRELDPIATDDGGFRYFKTEPMFHEEKPYRLIWLIDPESQYRGVVNCFMR